MPHNLYTYVPKKNTLKTDGLYGPSGDSEENLARRYGVRAGSTDKMDILNWLESTAPGRSHAVSVLTEPIPDETSDNIRAFRDASVQVTLPPYSYKNHNKRQFANRAGEPVLHFKYVDD